MFQTMKAFRIHLVCRAHICGSYSVKTCIIRFMWAAQHTCLQQQIGEALEPIALVGISGLSRRAVLLPFVSSRNFRIDIHAGLVID